MAAMKQRPNSTYSLMLVETRPLAPLLYACITLIYLSVAIGMLIEWNAELTQHFSMNWIALVGLAYFLAMLVGSWISLRAFYFLLPLVILSVPNAVNDLFPSFAMGPLDDLGASYLSFFTHIDIYILSNLIVHRGRLIQDSSCTPLRYGICLLVLIYAIGFLYASLNPERHVGSYVVWGFQFRYILLAVACIQLLPTSFSRSKLILTGTYAAIILVMMESALYTEFRIGSVFEHRFTSGNYGHNANGNLLAALAVSCFIKHDLTVRKVSFSGVALTVLFGVLTLGTFATETRMSTICLLVGIILYLLLRRSHFSSYPLLVMFIAAFLILSPLKPSSLEGVGSYSLGCIASVIGNSDNCVANDDVSAQAATIQTRAILWLGSSKMLRDQPITGVGLGEWNFVKSKYDISWNTLLDSHNDYLHFMAELGIPLGLFISCILFLLPWLKVISLRIRDRLKFKECLPLAAIPMTFALASLTNSNAHKHQLFMLLCFIVVTILWDFRVAPGEQSLNALIS